MTDANVPWYTTKVTVYRESDAWDKLGPKDKWFMLADHTLRDLYVCTYEIPTDDDGDPLLDPGKEIAKIRARHEPCVLVY